MIKPFNESQLVKVLRGMVKSSSVRKVGAALGVTGAYVQDVIKRRRAVSENLANALGFDMVPQPPSPRKFTRKETKV